MRKDKEDMTLVGHLGELRKRLIRVLIVLAAAMVGGFAAAQPVILYVKDAAPVGQIEWHVFSPWDSIRLYINVSFVLALVVALPFALYQLWAFTKPGLKPHERRTTLLYIPFACLLALLGLAFSYFVVFPFAFLFSTAVTENLGFQETYGSAQYFSFMFNILIPITLLFQLPAVVMFLTMIRILNPSVLRKSRRYAYLILVVLGTLFTPPDAISAIMVALPMILLYELSVWISTLVYRRRMKAAVD